MKFYRRFQRLPYLKNNLELRKDGCNIGLDVSISKIYINHVIFNIDYF